MKIMHKKYKNIYFILEILQNVFICSLLQKELEKVIFYAYTVRNIRLFQEIIFTTFVFHRLALKSNK